MCRSRPRRRAPGSARRSNPGNGPRVPRPGPGRDTRNRSRTRRSPRGRRSSGTRPGRCSWRHDSQVSTDREPRIDLHSHAGRCFLAGLPAGHSLVTTLGAASVVGAVRTARAAGMTALVLAAVADFAVLRPDPATGLRAHRDFRTGEAYADYQRQLAGIREAAAEAGAEVATSAADLDRAVRDGHTAVLLGCEGGDFLEGDLRRLEEARAADLTVLTLVHYRVSEIGDVQTEAPVHGCLSRFGRDVVAECLVGAWPCGMTRRSLTDFGTEILRLAEAAGPGHVAIGTDLDGKYRPVLTSYDQLDDLAGLLRDRGLPPDRIGQILGGNALDLLNSVMHTNAP